MRKYAILSMSCALLGACTPSVEGPSNPLTTSAAYETAFPANQTVTYSDGVEVLRFDTETEFADWARTQDDPSILAKWEALLVERHIVVADGLLGLDEQDPLTVEYTQELSNRVEHLRAGPGGLYDFTPCSTLLHLSDLPAPSISRNKRDRISGYCPIAGHVTGFDNTWYGGPSVFMAGAGGNPIELVDLGFDNRIASFF